LLIFIASWKKIVRVSLKKKGLAFGHKDRTDTGNLHALCTIC